MQGWKSKPTDATCSSAVFSPPPSPAPLPAASLSVPILARSGYSSHVCRFSQEGYWKEPVDIQPRFVSCPNPDRCLAGSVFNGSLCDQASISFRIGRLAFRRYTLRRDLQAYDGRQCAACHVGYYRFLGDCEACPGGEEGELLGCISCITRFHSDDFGRGLGRV